MHIKIFIPIFDVSILFAVACSSSSPKPFGPVPSEAQIAWQRMEINMFCHFGPNTFTDTEWGSGNEAEEVFAPTALDCRQWVDVARQAGMGGIILTAKHHDGFCLWPSAYSNHTVIQSTWNEGHGDVLREFASACHEGGIKAGVYISPWDRNHPAYGTEEYNIIFANTLREVHNHYGPFFEQWFDGACGEGPNGKRQEYNWTLFNSTVLNINPNTIIFSDWGPGCRWVGNEDGRADETCWSTVGDSCWIPVEADVSIRPGWFWHADEHPKTVDELMEIYYNSVGRNALLLLNVPPDNRGLISAEDSAVLMAFRQERDRIFSKDLAQGAKIDAYCEYGDRLKDKTDQCHPTSNLTDTSYHTYWTIQGKDTSNITLIVELPEVQEIDMVMLQEYIPLGQRVTKFSIAYADPNANGEMTIAEGTTIGYKRIVRFSLPIRTKKLYIHIVHALAPPVINRIALYNTQAQ